ncbi:RIP metalloprotease [uncultured Anaerococcus sp.]|uniref:M50 family metallopeptidase n=1 Tax=uncultured Anaerococcus sp. TaxID=293428 RepID=UPI00261EDBFA|nr:M50 family metallopeptidase [uncultured Anaerococcus sp.]
MIKIIIAIAMFLFLILIHEFGHFIVAKLSGIRVNEFAIGMGPAFYSKQKGETLYSLRMIPMGGYCAMEGEEEESSDPRSYDRARPISKFLTILAGPMMNLILASVIFFVVGLNTGVTTTSIGNFTDNSPAKQAGMEIGDEVVEVNHTKIEKFSEISAIVNAYYKDSDIKEKIDVKVYRKSSGKEMTFSIAPQKENGNVFFGVESQLRKAGVLEAIKLGLVETIKNIIMIFVILGRLFTGKIALSALSGPVGVVKELGNQAQNGLMSLLYFLGYISVNLGVFNLLPIPALDGSKLVCAIYEMLTGKTVNKKIEEKVTIGGFVVLIGLIILISIKDIISLF